RSHVADLAPGASPSFGELAPQIQRHMRWTDDRCTHSVRTSERGPRVECLLIGIDGNEVGTAMAHRPEQPASLVSPDGTAEAGLFDARRPHPRGDEHILDRISREKPDGRR